MIHKYLVIIVLILLSNACAMHSESEPLTIDELFADYRGNTVPGAAVLVVRNGDAVIKQGFGMADFATRSRVNADTNFRLASVSKQFTALAVLQLVEAGKIDLSSRLSHIFPTLPKWSEHITINDMLRHTSGMLDYESLVPESFVGQVVDADVFNILATQQEVVFGAGAKYQYSNSAYALLALVVEKVSGLTFSDYLEQNVFKPLQMTQTIAFNHSRHTINNRAYGYAMKDDGTIELADQSVFSAVLGDGGIYSNLNDLHRWILALEKNDLLNNPLNDAWITDQKNDAGEPINYGYGWRLEEFAGHKVTYHTGISRGFRNVLYRLPEQQLTIVILTNRTTDGRYTPLQMARKIAEMKL